MSFANYTISFSNEFEITRVALTVVIGKSNRVEHRRFVFFRRRSSFIEHFVYVLHNSTEFRIVFRIRQSPSHIEGKRESSTLTQSLFLDFPISLRHSNLLLIHCNSTISMQGPFHERTWSLYGNEFSRIIGRFN